jgi:vancomycin resistance protein YoaR
MAKAAPPVGVRGRRSLMLAAGVVIGLGLLVVLASVAEHVWYSGSVLPGVRIEGAQIGGRSDAQARAALQRLATRLQSTPIRAHAGGRVFTVDPRLIDFDVDVDATMQHARDAGRDANPVQLVSDTVLRRFRPDVVQLAVHYDQSAFAGLLDGWSTALQSGLVEGGLRFSGTTVVPVEPHAGRGLLRDEAQHELAQMLADTKRSELTLPVGTVQPLVDRTAVADAARRARAVLTGNYVVVAGATRVTLTPEQIAPALETRVDGHTLDLVVDGDKLRFALGPALAAAEQPPVDATFDVSNPDDVKVVPSSDGRQLDTAAIGAAIVRGQRRIVATIRNEHPVHDTNWARALGIRHQVSSFTTYHNAGEARVTNIHLAANVLNNSVVEPGQTFSLNQKLGPRTPEKGYVKAPIILEDGFGEDYGGGISQLTTTLYNAVFFGGYVDVEHSPHHYYISRYPMGREATIAYPYVDLKFRDDTKHGVLIRTYYTDTSITVTLYGDNDGRTVKEENRQILHTEPITDRFVPCPAAKPTDDPNNACAHLQALARDTVAIGETGYDVEFDRVIDQPGHPEVRQHYRVHYPMLQNTVLVGTAPSTSTTTTPTTATTTKSPTTKTSSTSSPPSAPHPPPTTAKTRHT